MARTAATATSIGIPRTIESAPWLLPIPPWGDYSPGDDRVVGGDGNDTLSGFGGDDDIRGGSGDDLVSGGGGNDALMGGGGDDTASGGLGHDWLVLGGGTDTGFGGPGQDTLLGGGGDDALHGEVGHDTVYGESGNDRLFGGDGNDVLWGGGCRGSRDTFRNQRGLNAAHADPNLASCRCRAPSCRRSPRSAPFMRRRTILGSVTPPRAWG